MEGEPDPDHLAYFLEAWLGAHAEPIDAQEVLGFAFLHSRSLHDRFLADLCKCHGLEVPECLKNNSQ